MNQKDIKNMGIVDLRELKDNTRKKIFECNRMIIAINEEVSRRTSIKMNGKEEKQ